MNTAILGLQLLMDTAKVRVRDNPSDEDWADQEDLLNDVHSSTFTAVQLLNDLLHTEGLTSGVHDLNRKQFAVIPLLTASLAPCVTEARLKGITLSVAFREELEDEGDGMVVVPGAIRGLIQSMSHGSLQSLQSPRRRSMQTRGISRVHSVPVTETDTIFVDERKFHQVLMLFASCLFFDIGNSLTFHVYYTRFESIDCSQCREPRTHPGATQLPNKRECFLYSEKSSRTRFAAEYLAFAAARYSAFVLN